MDLRTRNTLQRPPAGARPAVTAGAVFGPQVLCCGRKWGKNGSSGRTRTCNTLVNSQVLYH
jgi:hypothetical protein